MKQVSDYYKKFLHNDGISKEMYNENIELIYDVDAEMWYAFNYISPTHYYEEFEDLIDALDSNSVLWWHDLSGDNDKVTDRKQILVIKFLDDEEDEWTMFYHHGIMDGKDVTTSWAAPSSGEFPTPECIVRQKVSVVQCAVDAAQFIFDQPHINKPRNPSLRYVK
jgi:hypothetical protein